MYKLLWDFDRDESASNKWIKSTRCYQFTMDTDKLIICAVIADDDSASYVLLGNVCLPVVLHVQQSKNQNAVRRPDKIRDAAWHQFNIVFNFGPISMHMNTLQVLAWYETIQISSLNLWGEIIHSCIFPWIISYEYLHVFARFFSLRPYVYTWQLN